MNADSSLFTSNLIGMNLFAYCVNNPVNHEDLSGKWFGIDDVFTGPVDEIIVFGVLFVLAAFGVGWAQQTQDQLLRGVSNWWDSTVQSFLNDYAIISVSLLIASIVSYIQSSIENYREDTDSGLYIAIRNPFSMGPSIILGPQVDNFTAAAILQIPGFQEGIYSENQKSKSVAALVALYRGETVRFEKSIAPWETAHVHPGSLKSHCWYGKIRNK